MTLDWTSVIALTLGVVAGTLIGLALAPIADRWAQKETEELCSDSLDTPLTRLP